MAKGTGSAEPIIIKKYANRRLYDTSTSSYVTLDHLSELVREGRDFEVRDAKTGEDLTRQVLTQIIFEQETKGEGALPLNFLRQLIGFYGDSLQSVVPGYLQMSMNSFAQQQEEFRERMTEAMTSPQASMAMIEEQTRRNMEMFGQAMRMFSPFNQPGEPPEEAGKAAPEKESEDLSAMREELDAMRAKLDQILDKKT